MQKAFMFITATWSFGLLKKVLTFMATAIFWLKANPYLNRGSLDSSLKNCQDLSDRT